MSALRGMRMHELEERILNHSAAGSVWLTPRMEKPGVPFIRVNRKLFDLLRDIAAFRILTTRVTPDMLEPLPPGSSPKMGEVRENAAVQVHDELKTLVDKWEELMNVQITDSKELNQVFDFTLGYAHLSIRLLHLELIRKPDIWRR